MEFLIIFGFAFFILAFLYKWAKKMKIEGEEALAATCADCDSGERAIIWIRENGAKNIKKSEIGTRLVREWADAYEEFLRTHSTIDGKKHLRYIKKLLK